MKNPIRISYEYINVWHFVVNEKELVNSLGELSSISHSEINFIETQIMISSAFVLFFAFLFPMLRLLM